MVSRAVVEILNRALGDALDPPSFRPLVLGLRDSLVSMGIPVERIQVPMNRQAGFRHPSLAVAAMTWCDDRDFEETFVVPHERYTVGAPPPPSPYADLLAGATSVYRVRVDTEVDARFPVLAQLGERGYREYCAFLLELPEGISQPMSIATRGAFPVDLEAQLAEVRAVFSLAVYGVYRASQAIRVARSYIGPRSGLEVLAGNIRRGSTQRLQAGILFCDIRGFTALSERVPPEEVLATVNEVFALIEVEATARGGEILKFIGDAMLLVFPVDGNPSGVARAMVETASNSRDQLAQSELDVGVCFGGHIGEVIQGNLGTPERLDFTVMGAAVNLASRLESLCRPLGVDAVFSETVAAHVPTLRAAGEHALKGIQRPVPVFELGS